jgi:hypothetical protein
MQTNFWSEILEGRNHLEHVGMDDRVIFKRDLIIGWEVVD